MDPSFRDKLLVAIGQKLGITEEMINNVELPQSLQQPTDVLIPHLPPEQATAKPNAVPEFYTPKFKTPSKSSRLSLPTSVIKPGEMQKETFKMYTRFLDTVENEADLESLVTDPSQHKFKTAADKHIPSALASLPDLIPTLQQEFFPETTVMGTTESSLDNPSKPTNEFKTEEEQIQCIHKFLRSKSRKRLQNKTVYFARKKLKEEQATEEATENSESVAPNTTTPIAVQSAPTPPASSPPQPVASAIEPSVILPIIPPDLVAAEHTVDSSVPGSVPHAEPAAVSFTAGLPLIPEAFNHDV